jgi:hypothetical protein
MADELAIPYLSKEMIIASILNESAQNKSRPVQRQFKRVGHGAEKVEVRERTRYSDQVRHTTMDGEGVPIKTGTFKVREYGPAWLKVFAELTAKDIALFARAEEAAQMASPGPEAIAFMERANERIRELGADIDANLGAERERLCVSAFTGTLTATLQDGTSQSVSYNLSALTAPSTKWDNASATIIANLYAAIDEYKANNPLGLPPTRAKYHPRLYREAFVGNTEWKDFKKASPDLAAGFLRLSGTRNEANNEGFFSDPLFGLTWEPVDGTYRDLDGTVQNYWNYKDITLYREDEAGLEWAMTHGHTYNPRPEVNIEVEGPSRKDVQVWKIHGFDNGLPVVKRPAMIQTYRVIT